MIGEFAVNFSAPWFVLILKRNTSPNILAN